MILKEARAQVFDGLTYFKITKTRVTDTYPPPGFCFWGTGNIHQFYDLELKMPFG